ncbi:Histone deacetylase 8 [Coemansia sp. RSA 1752]|nr:Histone deacetylase 8 [Coemansia sp. RSA 1752]
MGRKVALVRSAQSIQAADSLPSNVGRASRVHALIDAFGLNDKLDIIEPEPLDNDALTIFHSEEYIDCLFAIDSDSEYSYGSNKSDEDDEKDRQQRFGLVHDCALFEGVEEHVRYAAGGTVAAANILVDGQAQIAIHWEGGRHHSQRSKAAGFCYVNDVVLGILALQKRFSRVLYIDLDLHHGDGVQDAFLYSSRVMTLSLHHYDCGFYPNSGGEISEGRGNGAGYSVNVPLQRGTNDSSFIHVFSAVANKVLTAFDPEVIVVQCGCDGLAGDPHKIFNLTSNAFARSIKTVLGWERPALLLGGGGYSLPECARCWTRLTAIACGYDIAPEADVPEHVFLNEYAPGFDMLTDVMLIEDSNTNAYLDSIVQAVQAALPNQS